MTGAFTEVPIFWLRSKEWEKFAEVVKWKGVGKRGVLRNLQILLLPLFPIIHSSPSTQSAPFKTKICYIALLLGTFFWLYNAKSLICPGLLSPCLQLFKHTNLLSVSWTCWPFPSVFAFVPSPRKFSPNVQKLTSYYSGLSCPPFQPSYSVTVSDIYFIHGIYPSLNVVILLLTVLIKKYNKHHENRDMI